MKIKQWVKQVFGLSPVKDRDWIKIDDNPPRDGELVHIKGVVRFNETYNFQTIGFVKKSVWYYFAGPSEFRPDETIMPYFWRKVKT